MYQSGFGTGGSDAAATNSSVNYTRVRYRMQYTHGGSNLYVDANFNRTLGDRSTYSETFDSVSRLRVPTTSSGFEIQGDISDLAIETNATNVPNGSGFAGRLEIWPWNYGTASPSKVGGGTLSRRSANDLFYDDSDTANLNGVYGSFQLHRLSGVSSENQTIFAWNSHYDSTPDIGFGNNTSFGTAPVVHSDWTFNSVARTNFRLFTYIDKPVTTLRDTVRPTVSSFSSTQNPLTTNAASLTYVISFSENVNGITSADFTNTGNAPGCAFSPGTDTMSATRTVTVTGCGDGTVIPQFAADGASDAALNTGPVAAAIATTTVTRDATPPTVEVWSGPSSPSSFRTLSYTLTFSESVSGLAAGDFANSGTAAGCAFTPSGSSGTTFTVSVVCTSDGTVVAQLKAASVTDAGGNTGPTAIESATSVTIAAEITLTLNAQEGSEIASQIILIGSTIQSSPGTPTRDGFLFDGWSLTTDGDLVTFPFTHGKTASFTLYAQWTASTLTVTFDSRGGTAVAESITNVGISMTFPVTDPTRRGYTFDGWAASVSGARLTAPYAHGRTANFTLFARWVPSAITVTYCALSACNPGDVYATASTETGGVLASPGTPVRTGFDFAGWSSTDSGWPVTFPFTHNRIANFSLYALWRSTSEVNNVWFYPSAGPSEVITVVAPIVMTPAFPRSTETYTVTATVDSPLGIEGLNTVTMCWYKTGVGSPNCTNAASNPATEFLVTWDEAADEFIKTGTNHYALGTGPNASSVSDTVSLISVSFRFNISNAMRAGDWTVVVTALDDAGLVRSESKLASVNSFFSVMTRPQKTFGVLPRDGSYTVNDTLVGEYASNAAGDFSIEATPFNCAGCDSSHELTLRETGDPGMGEVALECSIASTLGPSPLRVTGLSQRFGLSLTETGETTNKNNKMSCRLRYGGGAKRALVEYSNTVTFAIGSR